MKISGEPMISLPAEWSRRSTPRRSRGRRDARRLEVTLQRQRRIGAGPVKRGDEVPEPQPGHGSSSLAQTPYDPVLVAESSSPAPSIARRTSPVARSEAPSHALLRGCHLSPVVSVVSTHRKWSWFPGCRTVAIGGLLQWQDLHHRPTASCSAAKLRVSSRSLESPTGRPCRCPRISISWIGPTCTGSAQQGQHQQVQVQSQPPIAAEIVSGFGGGGRGDPRPTQALQFAGHIAGE